MCSLLMRKCHPQPRIRAVVFSDSELQTVKIPVLTWIGELSVIYSLKVFTNALLGKSARCQAVSVLGAGSVKLVLSLAAHQPSPGDAT